MDYENIFETIPEDIEAVISAPLRHLTYEQVDDLFRKFIDQGIPVFTTFDEDYVEGSALAGYSSRDFFPSVKISAVRSANF